MTCPECAQGKHGNCDGTTWDTTLGRHCPCPCPEDGHPDWTRPDGAA